MNRRSALQHLATVACGLSFIPSCSFDEDKISIPLDSLKINASHEKLLSEVVETIIPETGIPGAKALGLHHFVLVMVNDCQVQSVQKDFVVGLDQIEPYVKKRYDQSFLKSNHDVREALLIHLMDEETNASVGGKNNFDLIAIKAFLSTTKQYTVQGFLASQFVMTEVFPYQLVPVPFKGCIPVSEVKTL